MPDTVKNFGEAVKKTYEAKGMKQADLARMVDMSPQQLNAIVNGRKGTTRDTRERIAQALGVPLLSLEYPDAYFPGMIREMTPKPHVDIEAEEREGIVLIPYLEATPAMGGASYVTSRKVQSHLAFRAEWIESKGRPSRMAVVRATGDSMTPTIPSGSVVLVDEGQKEIVSGKIYMIAHEEGILIKRLFKKGDDVLVYSDSLENFEYVTSGMFPLAFGLLERGVGGDFLGDRPGTVAFWIKKGDYFEIIGRCLWVGHDL